MCVYVSVYLCVCVSVCDRERRERAFVCLCVCVREREEKESVCVCVCVWEDWKSINFKALILWWATVIVHHLALCLPFSHVGKKVNSKWWWWWWQQTLFWGQFHQPFGANCKWTGILHMVYNVQFIFTNKIVPTLNLKLRSNFKPYALHSIHQREQCKSTGIHKSCSENDGEIDPRHTHTHTYTHTCDDEGNISWKMHLSEFKMIRATSKKHFFRCW